MMRMVLMLTLAAVFAGVAVLAQSADLGFPEGLVGYLDWERANPQKSFVESAHPVAKDVYFNEAAADSVHAGTFPHAYGSVFVKETLDPATLQVSVITTMQKVEGFNPDAGDWQYGRFDRQEDGTFTGGWMSIEAAAGCIACHADAADKDYTFLTYLD